MIVTAHGPHDDYDSAQSTTSTSVLDADSMTQQWLPDFAVKRWASGPGVPEAFRHA